MEPAQQPPQDSNAPKSNPQASQSQSSPAVGGPESAAQELLVGVVSDTHGNETLTRRAVRMLESLGVDVVLHCGDIGSTDVVPMFAPWPTHFVFGNVDLGFESELEEAITAAGQTCHGRFGSLDLAGRKVALIHSDDGKRFQQVITSDQYDLVVYGHTHVAKQNQVGKTLVLNPGAIHRANPHSIALVRLPALDAQIISID